MIWRYILCFFDMSVITAMKACRDCKYFQPNRSFATSTMRVSNGLCTHPKSVIVDVGSGAWVHDRADNMRKDGDDVAVKHHGPCGKDGKLFVQETNVIRKMLRDSSVLGVIDKMYMMAIHALAFLLTVHTLIS